MKGRAVVAFTFMVVCWARPPRTVVAQSPGTRADSAAIIRAVWDAALAGGTPPSMRARWFWAPPTRDSTRVVPVSAELRQALTQLGLPAFVRRPAGDDTLVLHLTRWRVDSAGVDVELASQWTVVLGTGPRRCRAGSGNAERFRVRREGGAWLAQRVGPIIHGDRACTPLQSPRYRPPASER